MFIWKFNSPTWGFDTASCDRTAAAFLNPDYETVVLDGKYDPFTPAGDGSSYRTHFTGRYQHRTFDVAHDVLQEAPREFARAVIDASHL